MRLPRVRFTMRQMMVATAIFGLLAWGYAQNIRSKKRELAETFWFRAEFHRKKLADETKNTAGVRARIARGETPYPYGSSTTGRQALAYMDRHLRYRETMRRRNLYAMEHPFEYTPPRENPNRDFAWTLAKPAPW